MKDAVIRIRIAQGEAARWTEAASQLGLSLSAWIRLMVSSPHVLSPLREQVASRPAGRVEHELASQIPALAAPLKAVAKITGMRPHANVKCACKKCVAWDRKHLYRK